MKIIVPLAGPDFISPTGQVKAEYLVDNKEPLLKWVLDNRSWYKSGYSTDSDMIFVFYDCQETRSFVSRSLKAWYPRCNVIYISTYTQGAALSALLGLAVIPDHVNETICIDLADIYYDETLNINEKLVEPDNVGALALTFKSTNPVYSYLRKDDNDRVVEAKEKVVISDIASAGTYFYKNAQVYLNALRYTIEHSADYEHNGLQFVCPVYNGVIAAGLEVALESVQNLEDIKILTQRN